VKPVAAVAAKSTAVVAAKPVAAAHAAKKASPRKAYARLSRA